LVYGRYYSYIWARPTLRLAISKTPSRFFDPKIDGWEPCRLFYKIDYPLTFQALMSSSILSTAPPFAWVYMQAENR
jgi:ABC-type glycerol-3-phosphate transport system permease component